MPSVVVVGAGLAGLSCAWRLQRAGFDVEVLEASGHTGGRLRTEDADGFLIEPGMASFSSHDRSLHSLVNHLDLASSVRPLDRCPDSVARAGGISALRTERGPLLLSSASVPPMQALRLLRLRIECMRWRRELAVATPEMPVDVGHHATPNGLRAGRTSAAYARLEAESVSHYLDRIVGAPLRKTLVAPYFSMALGLDAENISAAYLLALIDRIAGARPQYMTGGIDQLTTRLAESLSVRTRCEVQSLETQSDGARIRYRAGEREGSVVADSVVVALPGSRVLEVCPKLTPAERGFFEDVRYARSIDVHLLLDEPTSIANRSVCFPRRRGLGLYGVQIADVKLGAVPTGAGMLRASLSEATSEGVWRGADEEIGALVCKNLKMTPIGIVSPRRTIVNRCGSSAPSFYPSYLTKLARFNSRTDRSPRLVFCGDYLSGNGAEAALTSGMRAASQVARGLG